MSVCSCLLTCETRIFIVSDVPITTFSIALNAC